jgi:hypothetical protein
MFWRVQRAGSLFLECPGQRVIFLEFPGQRYPLEDFVASVGHYEGRGLVPRALLHGRHPLRPAPTLRIGYLLWSNALGTWPLSLRNSLFFKALWEMKDPYLQDPRSKPSRANP